MKRILIIEPYYGGSHRRFLDGLVRVIDADCTLLSLPARKWKMRMQLSAPWFIGQVAALGRERRAFDTVLFSTFIDVAVFRALAADIPGWNSRCRYCTYFHENQFAYPGVLDKYTNHQFTAINFTTALVSDSIAFNSSYNLSSFLMQCERYLAKAADMDLAALAGTLQQKSRVLYPGLDFSGVDHARSAAPGKSGKRIVWNHRWEHDKNPEGFFAVAAKLADEGVDFELIVLGQSFANQPVCFEQARRRLGDRIIHCGYVPDEDAYYRLLAGGDIVVSTAVHEFFGISVLEAVRAGCMPVLPERLAYPELFEDRFLYEDGGLYERLRELLLRPERLSEQDALRLTEPYDWRVLAPAYEQWLF